jgi:Protein of unknown function (DUF2384)
MIDLYHKKTLHKLVEGLTGSQAELWWKSPNKAFDGRTPDELMNEEEWTIVRDYLMNHAYGGQYG